MHHIRHNLIRVGHVLADTFTGAQSLAILPVMLMLCYLAGGTLPLLMVVIIVPMVAILCAYHDHLLRRALSRSDGAAAPPGSRNFEDAVQEALYRRRLRGGTVLCLMLEFRPERRSATAMPDCRAMQYLRRMLRRRDFLCVLGEGRFGIVLSQPKVLSAKDVHDLAQRLGAKMARYASGPGDDGGQSTMVGVVDLTGARMLGARDVIRQAESALAQARTLPAPHIHVARPERRGRLAGCPDLGQDMERAFENGEFIAWFQPQICARSGRVTGFEALARWHHPDHGVIPPGRFLAGLQKRCLLQQLHERILTQALDAVVQWSDGPWPAPSVGLNHASEDLSDPSLPDRIAWELDCRDLSPECLNIEILESVVATRPGDIAAQNIQRLSDLGCRIDLDDFGTGHASISSLRNFKLHRLKIDRSFVTGIATSPAQERMVAAILTMAKQLELETLAEGVETQGEADLLRRLGCDQLQGFAIARPMPLNDTLAWLEDRNSRADQVEGCQVPPPHEAINSG